MSVILDPAYLRELDALRHKLAFRTASGGAGEHGASARGASAEFREHRAYAPGDDLRRVDWLAFARTGQAVTKTFRAEQDVLVRIVVDDSASMAFGTPSKSEHARALAAGIAYLALAGGERAQLFWARGGRLEGTEPSRGRGGLSRLTRALGGPPPGGVASLAGALVAALPRWERPGGLVCIGDFLEPLSGLDAALRRATFARHDVRLVQVLAPEDVSPPFEGDLALYDDESEGQLELTVDAAALAAYGRRLVAHTAALAQLARASGGSYTRTTTAEPKAQALRRVVLRGIEAPTAATRP